MSPTEDGMLCRDCSHVWPKSNAAGTVPCPECESENTVRTVEMSGETVQHASQRRRAWPWGKGKANWFLDGFDGWDLSSDLGRLVRKISIFDKRANRRFEHVEDPVSGSVLHHEDHRLTDHIGRGSAKSKKRTK